MLGLTRDTRIGLGHGGAVEEGKMQYKKDILSLDGNIICASDSQRQDSSSSVLNQLPRVQASLLHKVDKPTFEFKYNTTTISAFLHQLFSQFLHYA